MIANIPTTILKAAMLSLVGLSVGLADENPVDRQMQEKIFDLQRQLNESQRANESLRASYIRVAKQAAERAEALVEARRSLEAIGVANLSGNDNQIVEAAAEIEQLNQRLLELETSVLQFSNSVLIYLAGVSDEAPELRADVEAGLRQLETTLGFRDEPSQGYSGDLSSAKVISIDSESGVIVLNLGRKQGVKVGMPFQLFRGDELLGQAIAADVRDSICGILIQQLEKNQQVRVGDSASVSTLQP